jgi:hypothetical protein
MRATAAILAACAALAACDAAVDRLASRIGGDRIIVMAPTPFTLTNRTIEIVAPEPMEVLGHWTSVCLVLAGDVAHSGSMDAKFAELMHNAKVNVTVQLGDGSRMPLSAPMPGWRKSGAILTSNELAGCASAGCLPSLPKGSFVTKVALSAEPELAVQGVYWASSPDLPSKPSASSPKPASAGGKEGSCG